MEKEKEVKMNEESYDSKNGVSNISPKTNITHYRYRGR